MSTIRQILVALNEFILNQPGFIEGMGRYLLTHPNLKIHTHVFMADPASNRRLLQNMIRHLRPDGVLSCVMWPVDDLALPDNTHLVSMGDFQRSKCPTVISDQEEAGRLAAAHLLKQGLPHYAFLASYGGYGASCRWQGFRRRVQREGCRAVRFDELQGRKKKVAASDECLAAWVQRLPKPVGVHAFKLFDAARLAWACQENGIRVPEDVALVGGQDNRALAVAWGPEISAIEFDLVRVGYEGLRMLDRLIQGYPAPTRPMLIPPMGLIARASSNLLEARDPEMAHLRNWLRDHAHRPIAVKDILARTTLSRRTLERRFTAVFGHSPHKEISLLRMARARTLLNKTGLSLTQVAAQSGYSNYITFALAFRRTNGMSASDFRRKSNSAAADLPAGQF